jgi:hypothetical protein
VVSLAETMQTRWNQSAKRKRPVRILYPEEIAFKNEREEDF